jgi:hypothetical protein
MDNLNFTIILTCNEGVGGYPPVAVGINDTVYYEGSVIEQKFVEFTAPETDTMTLFVAFDGNPTDKLIVDPDTGIPVNQAELVIGDISIDEVSLNNIPHNKGVFYVDESEIWVSNKVQPAVTHIGNKGVWRMDITSPVYIWLLENL